MGFGEVDPLTHLDGLPNISNSAETDFRALDGFRFYLHT